MSTSDTRAALAYQSDDPNGAGPEDGYTTLYIKRSPDGDFWLDLAVNKGERTDCCNECGKAFISSFRVRLSGSNNPNNFEVIKALVFLEKALKGETIPNPWD